MFLSQTPSRSPWLPVHDSSTTRHSTNQCHASASSLPERQAVVPAEGVSALCPAFDAPLPQSDTHRRSAPPIGSGSPRKCQPTPPLSADFSLVAPTSPITIDFDSTSSAYVASHQSSATPSRFAGPCDLQQHYHCDTQPSRALLLRNVAPVVDEAAVRRLLANYGPLLALGPFHKTKAGPASVIAVYFDVRHAQNAQCALNAHTFCGISLDVRFYHLYSPSSSTPSPHALTANANADNSSTIPHIGCVADEHVSDSLPPFQSLSPLLLHGTLVVFNLDASTSSEQVQAIFSRVGDVKEVRATPNKRHHKFIEFYDGRDAETALRQLNKTEVAGKKIKIEVSRPAGRSGFIAQTYRLPSPRNSFHESPLMDCQQRFCEPAAAKTPEPDLPPCPTAPISANILMEEPPKPGNDWMMSLQASSHSRPTALQPSNGVADRFVYAPHLDRVCESQRSALPFPPVVGAHCHSPYVNGQSAEDFSKPWVHDTCSSSSRPQQMYLSNRAVSRDAYDSCPVANDVDMFSTEPACPMWQCGTTAVSSRHTTLMDGHGATTSSSDTGWPSLLFNPSPVSRSVPEHGSGAENVYGLSASRSFPSVETNGVNSSTTPRSLGFCTLPSPLPPSLLQQQFYQYRRPSVASDSGRSARVDDEARWCCQPSSRDPADSSIDFGRRTAGTLHQSVEDVSAEHECPPVFNFDFDDEGGVAMNYTGNYCSSEGSFETSPRSNSFSPLTLSRCAPSEDTVNNYASRSPTKSPTAFPDGDDCDSLPHHLKSISLSGPAVANRTAGILQDHYVLQQRATADGGHTAPESPSQRTAAPRSEPTTPQRLQQHLSGHGPHGSASPGCGGSSNHRFSLSLEKVQSGADIRTALMIRNIPNKYNQKMLLSALEENHRGHFDFMYLPIDFKNKCNVGYAFINFTKPQYIICFYEEFHGRKWGKFNSEKVCEITYARIQGKQQLINHFQNSSLMNEDPKCRPVVFGQNGEQEEFPIGSNVRTRRGPSVRDCKTLELGTSSPPYSPGKWRDRVRNA